MIYMYVCAGAASARGGGMTSGLVGEMEHQVLPTIPPILTMILTLAAMMVWYMYMYVVTDMHVL